jgi:hypothetical protein
MQDHSLMELLVDGSTITITNHSLAGNMTLQVLSTTGLVGTGDFIAALHLIIASKDTTGGTLTVMRAVNEKRLVNIFYGVSAKNVPHLRIAGNAVVPYPVVLNYAGWAQALSADSITEKTIWAVGNKIGLKGIYKPFQIQEAENMANFYGGSPLSLDTTGVSPGSEDSETGDLPASAKVPEPQADGMDNTPEEVTWEQ